MKTHHVLNCIRSTASALAGASSALTARCSTPLRSARQSLLLALLMASASVALAAPPDLTNGGIRTDPTDTNLGATGMRGWIYNENADTTDSRQILVTSVEAGSPAGGILAADDVVLGVSGTGAAAAPFTADARKNFGYALTAAEARNPGTLSILRWRAGTTQAVEITLQTLGAYSATAPYNCPKSAAILEMGLQRLATQSPDLFSLSTLVLMASDDPSNPNNAARQALVRPQILAMLPTADVMAKMNSDQFRPDAPSPWSAGHQLIILSEYYLKTNDPVVLPAIQALINVLAKGQSPFGSMGHIYAGPWPDGSLNGPMGGYGAINSAAVPAFMGLLLAKECGITHPRLEPAIARASRFFASYAGKGSIPYGEHLPGTGGHSGNGKCGAAAIAFEMQGNRAYARDYFAKMATASGSEREGGHTGFGFNALWSPLGAAVGGDAAASAHFHNASWFFDMSRRWDGSFDYNRLSSDLSGNRDNWRGFRLSTASLLTYALPLRKLHITGRDRDPAGCMSAAEVEQANLADHYAAAPRTTSELLADLGSFSVVVRTRAATELAARTAERPQVLATLRAQIDDLNSPARAGACEALGKFTDPATAPMLVALLTDDDNNVRYASALALRSFPRATLMPLIYEILAAAATNAKPTYPLDEFDPAQFSNSQLVALLFNGSNNPGYIGLLKDSFTGIDRNYLYPAIRMTANHPLAGSRKMRDVLPLLTEEDFLALADVIVDNVHHQAPGDGMSAAVTRMAGLDALQPRNIAEGVPLAEVVSDTDERAGVSITAIDVLRRYAGSTTLVNPDPRTIDFLTNFWYSGGVWPDATAALAAIAADTNPVAPTPLKSIQSVTADTPSLTLPANWTTLRVKAKDYAKGDSRYTWRKVHGAGAVTFTLNGTAASKDTTVLFDGTPGPYLFEVTMSDSRGFTEVRQTVAVTLRDSSGNLPANSPPTADAQSLAISGATPAPITLTGSDPEGYALSYKITSNPANGTLTGTAPYLVYTPDNNYTGAESFTFEAMDSEGQVASATIDITVGAAVPTGLAVYEPFDYPTGALNGKSGASEVGFAAPWAAPTTTTLASDSLPYGSLLTKGGKATVSSNAGGYGAARVISPSALVGRGLLNDGATLWMSAMVGNSPTSDGSYLFLALANSSFATTGQWIQNEGAQTGAGIGFTISGPSKGLVCAASVGNTSTSLVRESANIAKSERYSYGESGLLVAKITWGATPADLDLIELYQPYTDLRLPEKPVVSLTAQVDQSTFDTLTWYRSTAPVLDEVRIGADYRSVLIGSADAPADILPPAPNPLGFHTALSPSSSTSLSMVASTAFDPHGVEYYFTCTAGGGHDSGWQSSPEYTDTSLTPGVTYSYTVKARDLSPARNETAPSAASSATLPTSTQVPVALGLPQAEAEALIISKGFTVGSVTTAPSSSVDQGDIASQSPAAGTSAVLGTTVNLVVSGTVQLATVPNLVGQSQSSAASALAAQDLVLGTVFTDYSETVPAGQIMLTNPAAGTGIAFGTAVNLVVSAGTANNLLPLSELLFEDFESPSTPTAYVQGSLPDNGKWVGASTLRGITDKAGGDFSAPDPNHQAFAMRYKQTGITTAEGKIGTLTLNTRYSLSFDVMRDGILSPGVGYICELVAFDPGTTRNNAGNSRPGTVLASASGNAPTDGSIARISLEFTAIAGSTSLGKDIGIRFVAPTTDTNALIDNINLWAEGVPLADTVPPVFVATSPVDGATGVGTHDVLTLTLNEHVAAGGGAFTLRNVTDGIQHFYPTADPSAVTISGNTVRLHPPGGLLPNKDYTVLVGITAITDIAGNRFAGISDAGAWNFTTTGTDISPPTLTITNDQKWDSVSVGDLVTYNLVFSEAINATTIDAGNFSNAGTSTISIGAIAETSPGIFSVPVSPTSAGTLQLQLNAGAVITDLAGNSLGTASPIADEEIITVIAVNRAPVWVSNPLNEIAATADNVYTSTLANDASDAENDPLTFSKISGPAWLAVAPNGALSGAPTNNDAGANSFTVSVSDGIAPAVEATLNISVLFNDPPPQSTLYLYYDGGSVDLGGTGNGASAGGTGTWNTSIKNWDAGVGNPYLAWNNANRDNAVINNIATITIGAPITVGTLTFSGSGSRTISGSQITINNGMSINSLAGLTWTAPVKLGASQTWIHNQLTSNSTGKSITGATNLNGRTLTWDSTNVQSNNRITHQNITDTGYIIKNGTGWLGLGGTNTYTGSTTINAGTIDAASTTALGNANNQLTINTGGTLNIAGAYNVAIGNLNGTGGVITSTHTSGTRTLTIGSGNNGGGNFQGVIQNGTSGSTTALAKIGTGTITLSGSSTYTGATTVNGGTLFLTGASQGTASITFTGGSLGLDTGINVTASSAAVNLANGTIKVTGTTGDASYTLLTAASITGTPVLANPVPGYGLQVVGGTELRLVADPVLPNEAPVFVANPIPGADATEDTAYSGTLAGSATDANNDTLTYAKVSGPAWLSVAPDGTLSGTPTNSDVGVNVFTVSVSDGIAPAVEASLNITVINTNDAPVWTISPIIGPDATARENYSASLAESAADPDADANLSFSLVDGPSWLSVASDGTVSGTPVASDAGLNVFTVSVSDGLAEPVNTLLHITVINVNEAPVFVANPITGADATEDSVYTSTLAGSATDTNSDTLIYAKVSGPAWLTVAADGTLSGTPTNSEVGANSFTVTVSDGIAPEVEAILTITVINTNDAPVFAANPISGNNGTQDTAYTGTLAGSATDANSDPLTYAKVSGPAWLAVAPNGTLSGTPANSDVGANAFTVSVSDGIASPVTASLNIMVANVNDAPGFLANPILGGDATEDAPYTGSIADSAFDVDANATLAFAKESAPAWLSVAADGTLSGTPSNSDVGLNEFTVSVSDGIAPAVEAILNITVINTNDAPAWIISPLTGADATAGENYSASLAESAADPDADANLSFSLVEGSAWLTIAADGTLSGTPGYADAGVNVFTVSVSDGLAEPVNTTLNITVINTSDVQLWRDSFGGADLTDLAADYDGDGLSNGEERIWGLDPTKGSSHNPISTLLNPANGKFHYTRRDPALTGKTFTVWTSGNLVAWTQDTAATHLPVTMVNAVETVEVTLTAAPVNGRLFVRVQASD